MLFDPHSTKPFRLSRSKLELFLNCPRCFYLDRRLGVSQPAGFPFNLNSAVDHLLKKEFDYYRAKGEPHPLMVAFGVKAIPFTHHDLDTWRDALRGGVVHHHKPTQLLITGGLDDVWLGEEGSLHVVDYKATSKDGEITLDADWQRSYKNQVEIYQWLLRRNGFTVSPTAYFVYVNGRRDRDDFSDRLEFISKIIPYQGDDAWLEPLLQQVKSCLLSESLPAPSATCEFCRYRATTQQIENLWYTFIYGYVGFNLLGGGGPTPGRDGSGGGFGHRADLGG